MTSRHTPEDRLHAITDQVLVGERLWTELGFRSEHAFQRARRRGWAECPLYPIPGQSRGVYARPEDVAEFKRRKQDPPGKGGAMS